VLAKSRAVVFAKTKIWERNDAKFCDANFPVQAAGAFVACSLRAVEPLYSTPEPPDAFSFADELILQQIEAKEGGWGGVSATRSTVPSKDSVTRDSGFSL